MENVRKRYIYLSTICGGGKIYKHIVTVHVQSTSIPGLLLFPFIHVESETAEGEKRAVLTRCCSGQPTSIFIIRLCIAEI